MKKRYDKITIRVNNILEKLLISIQDKLKSLDEELIEFSLSNIKVEFFKECIDVIAKNDKHLYEVYLIKKQAR